MNRVLVTGVSGFLGGHVALRLLASGYDVLGSVRAASKIDATRRALREAGAALDRLAFCQLDLLDDAGWAEAAAKCSFTIHVASPFVTTMPKDAAELTRPAIEGTERALRAAWQAGHQRIVLTSSLAAIDCGHADHARPLNEDDWTDLGSPLITAYIASKTMAERHAWALAEAAGATQRLAVINPGAMLGPLIDEDPGTSAAILLKMLRGEMPFVPNVILEYVDVRDVAAAHVAALTSPTAGGRRHILAESSLSLMDVAAILRTALPQHAAKLPRHEMPAWLTRLVALWDAGVRDSRAFLGLRNHTDHSRGLALLGHALIPAAASVAACGQSITSKGLL